MRVFSVWVTVVFVACGTPAAPPPQHVPSKTVPPTRALQVIPAPKPPVPAPPQARARRALVIGNAKYPKGPLKNPVRDAEAIEKALKAVAFDSVVTAIDADKKRMREAVNAFVESLGANDAAVVFYAGHGIEVAQKNYLLPVDFDAKTEADAADDGYPLETLLKHMQARKGGVNVVILDACRDDPYSRAWTRDGRSRGFAEVHPVGSTLIWYSTRPGETADDGDGDNSPFVTAFVAQLARTPATRAEALFYAIKRDVRAATGDRQMPFQWIDLDESFTFAGTSAAAAVPPPPPPVPTGPAGRALVIGVSTAMFDGREYKFVVARDVRAANRTLARLGYTDITTIEDSKATAPEIRTSLDALVGRVGPGDRVTFYFAGPAFTTPSDASGDEADGKDEVLVAHGAKGDAKKFDLTTVITDDELAARLQLARKKAGRDGHVLVVLDAWRLYETGSLDRDAPPGSVDDLAPVTFIQPPHDMAFEDTTKTGQDDPVGVLTTAWASGVANAELGDSYRQLSLAMWSAIGANARNAFRMDGDIASEIGTDKPLANGAFFAVNPELRYGASSVYLRGGKLDGIFAGSEVSLFQPTRFPPKAAPIARGVVVQTGLRWARVELGAPPPAGETFALVTGLAMPPGALAIAADKTLQTRRAELEAMFARIRTAAAAPALLVVEQAPYLHVVNAKTRAPIAPPLLASDPQIAHRVADVFWQHAYAKWLATVKLNDPEVTLGGGWDAGSAPCAPISVSAFHLASKPSPGNSKLPDLQSRGIKIVSRGDTPQYATALRIGDDGTIEPIGGVEVVRGRASSCVEGGGVVRVFGSRDPIDLVHAYATPASRAERALPVVAKKKDETPIGALEPRTRELLESLDHISSTSLVKQAVQTR